MDRIIIIQKKPNKINESVHNILILVPKYTKIIHEIYKKKILDYYLLFSQQLQSSSSQL